MMNYNKTIFTGNVGKDLELKNAKDSQVVNFSVAVSEKIGTKEITEWHEVTAWGNLATIAAQILKKGSHVLIEGKLRSKDWEKDGVKQKAYHILAESLVCLDKKQESK